MDNPNSISRWLFMPDSRILKAYSSWFCIEQGLGDPLGCWVLNTDHSSCYAITLVPERSAESGISMSFCTCAVGGPASSLVQFQFLGPKLHLYLISGPNSSFGFASRFLWGAGTHRVSGGIFARTPRVPSPCPPKSEQEDQLE